MHAKHPAALDQSNWRLYKYAYNYMIEPHKKHGLQVVHDSDIDEFSIELNNWADHTEWCLNGEEGNSLLIADMKNKIVYMQDNISMLRSASTYSFDRYKRNKTCLLYGYSGMCMYHLTKEDDIPMESKSFLLDQVGYALHDWRRQLVPSQR
jgi:hypothetical protein